MKQFLRDVIVCICIIIITCVIASTSGCVTPGPDGRAPGYRLCGARPSCWEKIEKGPNRVFDTPEEALIFGLAWLHMTHPVVESAIGIYETEEGGRYIFEEAGIGGRKSTGVRLKAGALATAHTHVGGDEVDRCSTRDRVVAAKLKCQSFMQHRDGRVVLCEPLHIRGNVW